MLASIEENKDLNFKELSQKSHKSAWENALNNEMSFTDIAIEGHANDEIVKYINLNLENQSTKIEYAIG